nr:transposase (putative), gypsy type [Tanacetum cinerariifolium]
MVRDSVQLETAVNTISYEYLLDFTSEYGIPEVLHPELPGPGDRIVDFPEGKVGAYTRFFEFANFRLPLSQFLFDVLGKRPGKNTPQCYTKPLDSLKNWNNRFFWVDERVFPTVVDWRTNASKDGMPMNGTYSVEDVRVLDTHRTPIQKQPEMLLCMVGISCRYYPGDEVYPTFHYDDDRGGNGPVQFDSRSESYKATDSSGVPSTIERSPLDFAHEAEASGRGTAAPEMPPPEDVHTTTAPGANQVVETVVVEPYVARESRKRGHEGTDANTPQKSLRRDHADLRPSGSSRGGKSLAAMQLCLASNVFVSEGVPADVSDPDPLAFADAPSPHPADVAQSSQGVAAVGDPESKNVSSPAEVGSPGSVYRPEWGVTNGSLLDTPEVCQDLVDHVAPPGYFSELRHMHNKDFIRQYNINLSWQVAMGSQLRLRFEQEAKLLRKSIAQVARRDQRIQARESEIKNLEALLETEAGIKRAAKEKSDGLSQELERMRAQFSELQ